MFDTRKRQRCERALKPLVSTRMIQDSSLLQAYISYKLACENPGFSCREAAKKGSSLVLLQDLSNKTKYDFSSGFKCAFGEKTLLDFIRFVVPGIVANVSEVGEFFDKNHIENLQEQGHLLIMMKLSSYHRTVKGILENKEIRPDFEAERTLEQLKTTDAHAQIYSQYCEMETVMTPLQQELFWELYQAVNIYSLNEKELAIDRIQSAEAQKMIHILGGELHETRQSQRAMAADFYIRNLQGNDFLKLYGRPLFEPEIQPNERKNLLRNATKSMAKLSPLNTLCSIEWSKSTRNQKGISSQSASIPRNDVALENGFLYSVFTSQLDGHAGEKECALVFFPTPFFIRKWGRDEATRAQNVTFVMGDPASAELLTYHYSQDLYTDKSHPNMRFCSYEQWEKELDSGMEFPWKLVLLFAMDLKYSEKNQLLETILRHQREQEISLFALLPRVEFHSENLGPRLLGEHDSEVIFESIALLPQGINNSKRPCRKLFLKARIPGKTDLVSEEDPDTKLYLFGLNMDFDKQGLELKHLKIGGKESDFLPVNQGELRTMERSIRDLFGEELRRRREVGGVKERELPISYGFTSDLTIWCVKSHPKGIVGGLRLEAYICEPADTRKGNEGVLNRGKRMDETLKATTSIGCQDINHWLENVYPFANRSGRNSKKTPAEERTPQPITNIRDVIIEKTAPWFDGENLALKTFWYVYPPLKNDMTPKDYRLLTELVHTRIGDLYVADAEEQDYLDLLQEAYPDGSKELLRQAVQVLYIALDMARRQGHCQRNVLQQAVTDERHSRKLFANIRSALVIRSLTLDELLCVYTYTIKKLEAGEWEYLGVLLRLLTGLESNIVCALEWKDFVKSEDFSLNQLVISRQTSNDGQNFRGFDSLEDYRVLPCCSVLAEWLGIRREKMQKALMEVGYSGSLRKFPILCDCGESPADYRDFSQRMPPKELDKLCKEVLKEARLDDHMIQIPDSDGGWKETNLSHYQGDFFRMNFKYWAVELCKFTQDELAFFVGNVGVTTVGRNYCDYQADTSQLILFAKLQRLEALLRYRENALPMETIPFSGHPSYEIKITRKLGRPIRLQLWLHVSGGSGEVKLTVNSDYGVSTYLTRFSGESERGVEIK